MTRLKSIANLTHFDGRERTPELQLTVQQITAHKAPLRSLELFNTAGYERWADALRVSGDASMCAQQHRESKLNTSAMQRAPAKRSH